jgi:hypothetical protein
MLLAFAGKAAVKAHIAQGGVPEGTQAAVQDGASLLVHWHKSQETEAPLSGIVFQSLVAAERSQNATAFVPPMLQTMLGFALALRAEAALAVVGQWVSEGGVENVDRVAWHAARPSAELQVLAAHPFSVLLHTEEQRLLSPPPLGGPLLLTGPDLVAEVSSTLGPDQAPKFTVANFTLPMVVEALLQSEHSSGLQVQVAFGWAEPEEGGATRGKSKVMALPPAAELKKLLEM